MERPSRSDVHVSIEEESKREEEARGYFECMAPKRHTKPQRSDYSSHYTDSLSPSQRSIPELSKFELLQTHPQKLVNMGSEAPEEYTETEYYNDLNCVDKQHHTTGTGFIKMETANRNGFCLDPSKGHVSGFHGSCKGNPATNEWIPATDNVIPASEKPNRSDY